MMPQQTAIKTQKRIGMVRRDGSVRAVKMVNRPEITRETRP